MPGDDVFAALLSRGRRPRSPALWDHSCVMAARAAAVIGASLLLLYYTCGREGCSCNRSTRSEASPVIIGCLQRVRLSQKGAYVQVDACMASFIHIHGLLKYMASSGPMCGHLKEAIYASGCWGRYPWSQPLCSRYTAVYGISAEGEAVRGRAIFFVIYTHSDKGGWFRGKVCDSFHRFVADDHLRISSTFLTGCAHTHGG